MSHTRYEPARQRLQRSELAVPGSQPAMFRKALESEADYVFLDLEDAVAPGDKEQARTQRDRRRCSSSTGAARGKTISVRINGIDTHYMYRDVVDVVEQAGHRLDTVLIPKVGVPADVYLVDALLTQIEEAKGIPHRIGIDVLIETALGMANVEAIAQSSRRLEAMHFGVADYAASCRARTVSIGGLNPDYPGDQWHAALSRMVVACRAYGLRADRRAVRRLQGSRRLHRSAPSAAPRSASRASGRSIPVQIALANEVFTPPPAEVDRAQADSRRAGGGGPRGPRRGAARRPDDRRGVGADGAERGGHGGGDRRRTADGGRRSVGAIDAERLAVIRPVRRPPSARRHLDSTEAARGHPRVPGQGAARRLRRRDPPRRRGLQPGAGGVPRLRDRRRRAGR